MHLAARKYQKGLSGVKGGMTELDCNFQIFGSEPKKQENMNETNTPRQSRKS